MRESKDLWVFGYGSLMWRPGFDFEEQCPAWVQGYHRSLCIFSHVHRGTPEKPGLVLGLDLGGTCQGVAFRVSSENWANTLDYLREREQVTSVYIEKQVVVELADQRKVQAIAYVVDQTHPQYAGCLPHHELVRLVKQGHGISGANVDYIKATFDHLVAAGIEDKNLAAVVFEIG